MDGWTDRNFLAAVVEDEMENQQVSESLRESWRTLRRSMPDIHQDSYTVEGLSHLLGIPRDVIAHEITTGQLRAVRCGPHTICIDRTEVVSWLQRRGSGI
jgi:excisionase family DNA binding protein